MCCDHVEGGMYIGPEFLLGQVYDGTGCVEEGETVVLYRPVYVCVKNKTSSKTEQGSSTTKCEDSAVPPKSPRTEVLDSTKPAQAQTSNL